MVEVGHLLAPAFSESCREDLSQLEGHDRAASRVGLPAQQCHSAAAFWAGQCRDHSARLAPELSSSSV